MTTTLPMLLPSNPSFAGHQTFAMRSGWLKKGLDALSDPAFGGSTLFNRDDAMVTLGVGKNMVQSIRHWLLATRVAEEIVKAHGREIRPTSLGDAVFGTANRDGWDSFLEDYATLWLLHWQLAGPDSLAFSWAYTFNRFREYEFTRDTLVEAVLNAANGVIAKSLSKETILRDVECLLHTYVGSESSTGGDDNLECPLQGLGLLRPIHGRLYRFQFGPKPTLPKPVFYYALLAFWDWKQAGSTSLSAWDITYAEGSPGQVFKLDDDSVMDYLDAISEATDETYVFEDTGIVREVVLKAQIETNPLSLLERYYHV
jgi:hypothetical protein